MDEQTFWYWVAVLDEDRCAMLIVDPARPCLDAAGLDENREPGRWLARLDELRAHTSISEIIVCHHMGHQADTGGRRKSDPEVTPGGVIGQTPNGNWLSQTPMTWHPRAISKRTGGTSTSPSS